MLAGKPTNRSVRTGKVAPVVVRGRPCLTCDLVAILFCFVLWGGGSYEDGDGGWLWWLG